MLTALTVLGTPVFASSNETVAPKVKKAPLPVPVMGTGLLSAGVEAAVQVAVAQIDTKKAEVLRNLESFRNVTQKRTEFNGSYSMQDMLGLLDSYLELANLSEDAAVSLNPEINKPIQAGWGRTITIAQFVRDNSHHVMAGTSTANDFDRFETLLGKTPQANVNEYVAKTVAAAPGYADKTGLTKEAENTFKAYFAKNPKGQVQEAAYKPLADLLLSALGLNRLIARTPNVDDRENFAIQQFFSSDIPGQYAALKAVNPELAAATNKLMNSFMDTVSNGAFYGGPDHPDMQAMRAFKADIGYRY